MIDTLNVIFMAYTSVVPGEFYVSIVGLGVIAALVGSVIDWLI